MSATATESVPRRVSDAGARIAAGRIGCTVAEYRAHEASGEAWCGLHFDWHELGAFGRMAHGAHGVQPYCRDAAREYRVRQAYHLTPEGAAVSRAQPAAASSGHPYCPPVLGCKDGRIPAGWVRAGGAS